jgi:glycosyltransferase involved in cell wall biosynthesis
MRCLHIVENLELSRGGVARALVDLTIALQRNGLGTTIACPQSETAQQTMIGQAHSPTLVALPNDRRFRQAAKQLIANCDILHLHTPWWLRNPGLVQLAVDLQKPVVLSVHGMLDDWSVRQKAWKKWGYLQMVAAKMMRRCIVHCTAEDERRQVLKRIVPLATEVLPLIIDKHYFTLEPNPGLAGVRWPYLESDQRRKLLFLSRIHPKKSLDIAIRALVHLRDCILTVAGPGEAAYVRSLQQLAEELGVAARIQWLGAVYGEEKDSLLSTHDCMLLPTQQENFGLVQVEGLAMGMQVITTFGTDIWRELRGCGAIVVERTPQAMSEAVRVCLADRTDRQQRMIYQRQKLLEWIEPDHTARKYIAMYEKYVQKDAAQRTQ